MATTKFGVLGGTYGTMNFNGNRQGVINPSSFVAMNGAFKEDERVSFAIGNGILGEVVGLREVNGILLPTMRETASAGEFISIARPEIFIPSAEHILFR